MSEKANAKAFVRNIELDKQWDEERLERQRVEAQCKDLDQYIQSVKQRNAKLKTKLDALETALLSLAIDEEKKKALLFLKDPIPLAEQIKQRYGALQERVKELEGEVEKGHTNEELQAREIKWLEKRIQELDEIKEWLRRRARIAGVYISRPHRTWGISANAMVEYALGGEFPDEDVYPGDESDMKACKLCRDSCPFELGDKMDEVLKIYQERFDKAQNPVAGEPPVGGR